MKTDSSRPPDDRSHVTVWIWDASGPAADACGVTGTAEAARTGRVMTQVPASKHAQAAAIVHNQIADGTLKPGQPALSRGS